MRTWPGKNDQACEKLRDSLEEAAETHADAASIDELMQGLPQEDREHVNSCESCRQAALDLIAVKEMFKGAPSFAQESRPWFAARVMSAIAARERELALRVSVWTEFPRFASRLAWITVVVLLAGTSWFYEKVVRAPSYPSNGTTQESIFDTTPQTNQDDILISMESNP